ncbi:unnamed protein product [Oppiella nova]|uniref:Nucleoporin Nup120/160 beta-propeller domain-containing protein n=1 Tax=Oppiella nova TaxID=334625 RepID=A0A7R9LLE6_9ACAR|nr:unnamed protein product [Oppiella nova]CAG2164135.1 unnamed protein product [Oppiella nova]
MPNKLVERSAANSTLQDFKQSESAGAFTYHDSNAFTTNTCNRFIYWKTSNDILELTELSMDVNLTGNQLKLHFQKNPVLEGVSIHETIDKVYILVATVSSVHRFIFTHPRKLGSIAPLKLHFQKNPVLEGVSIHETIDKVYILVATVSSVHRFIFTHPRKLGSIAPSTRSSPQSLLTSVTGIELLRPSIFYNVYTQNLDDPNNYSVLPSYGSSLGLPIPTTSCSWLTPQKEAVFVIANNVGSILVVKMGAPEHSGRLWNGIVPSIMRGTQEGDEAAVSLVVHPIQDDHLMFALCRDLRIRMWSIKRQDCLLSQSLLQQAHTTQKLYSNMNVRRPVILKKWISRDNSTLYLAAFIAGGEQRQFTLFQPILESNHYSLRPLAVVNAPEADLIDFCIANDQIWSLWLNANNVSKLLYCPIDRASHRRGDKSG